MLKIKKAPSLKKIKTLDGIKLEDGEKDYRTQYKTWTKRKNKINKIRENVYNKSNGKCVYCNDKMIFEEMTIDHLIPLNRNGTNADKNLVCSCNECNMNKGDLTLKEYYFIKWIVKTGRNKDLFKNTTQFNCNKAGIRYFLKRIDNREYFWFKLKYKLFILPIKQLLYKL